MRDLKVPRSRELEEAAARAAEAAVTRARRAGLVDVGYSTVDSPVGRLLVAGTRAGLVRLAYAEESVGDVLEELAGSISPRVIESPAMTDRVRRELDAYFEGRVRTFRTRIDWSLCSPGFFRRVLEATARIPFGAVSTYGTVAKIAGSPRAARAAGNALHDNPVPIVVPCHRVVPSSGGIGNYGGQEWRKEFLLTLEGAIGAER
ncbi:MAG TPA: methylated-DNA--[protein]-cysteine S-methyltransferase [Actinomycetota bacterium]